MLVINAHMAALTGLLGDYGTDDESMATGREGTGSAQHLHQFIVFVFVRWDVHDEKRGRRHCLSVQ